MVNLKYLVLLICFAQTLHYSTTENVITSIAKEVLPDCYFGVQTIAFILYSRDIMEGTLITPENMTSTDEVKNNIGSRKVAMLIHGFLADGNNSNYFDLSRVMLEKEDIVIISIDWKEGACSTGSIAITELAGYYKAVENTRPVGQYVANLTKDLIDKYDVKLEDIRVIGHSLGAQIAGLASKELQLLISKKYKEIIALDPAAPAFVLKNCSEKLCKSDADFLQIIHTTATLGAYEPGGHVDFYMSRGFLQPGCFGDPSCSHSRAVIYLTDSVEHECCFIGTPWNFDFFTKPISSCTKDTCICVGFNAINYPARGTFYVEVESKEPHCNNNGKIL